MPVALHANMEGTIVETIGVVSILTAVFGIIGFGCCWPVFGLRLGRIGGMPGGNARGIPEDRDSFNIADDSFLLFTSPAVDSTVGGTVGVIGCKTVAVS